MKIIGAEFALMSLITLTQRDSVVGCRQRASTAWIGRCPTRVDAKPPAWSAPN